MLSGLVEHSLVVVDRGEGLRYRMLEPVRQYAQRLLKAIGESEDVRRRHANYYLKLAEQVKPGLRAAPAGEWLDRLEAERDNVRAAVSWTLSHGEAELAVRLTYALWEFFWARGHYDEVLRWMEEALASGDRMTPGGRARALFVAELLQFRLGGHAGLLSAFEEIVTTFKAEGHLEGSADIYMMTGLASLRAGDAARAEELLEEGRRLFESIGDEGRAALMLVFIGAIPLNRGDYERAERYFERGLKLGRRSADPGLIYPPLYHLAQVAQCKGDYPQARRCFEEVMTLVEGIGDKAVIALSMVGLAECSAAQGKPERAAQLYGAADAVFSSVGMSFHPFSMSAAFHERYVNLAREQLGNAVFDAARAEGRAMSFEQAIEYALDWDEPSTDTTRGRGR